ncbi:SDR family NAD(P)-dependent oxidoreductase [Tuberibacillus sp. Marseille-P3662]|uniref:SDR family NAD(P)-dependent oxidoreductase n=1 Tax=Tuberibacillus sp. Marseille-P3662 TaxID=1965358 RepID=UPI000A1CC2B3|nr:SDR family NAD(P)-dependent oxidoreductase [Tuberibacillus sp. Marseille-P3662]
MNQALVLGASGGMGYSIVQELTSRGIPVKAFARTKHKLERLFGEDPNVTTISGDVFQLEDLRKAASGVDVIFHSVNIPYARWEKELAQLMNNIVDAAKSESAKLAIVDNIYAYGRSPGQIVNEMSPKNPHTKKGNIRLEVERLVKRSGVPALFAHFPDFFGPKAERTILNVTLKNVVRNNKASFVGSQKVAKEFIFTPDGAKAIVNLSLNDHAYGQNWNIPGYGVITGEELIQTIRSLTNYTKRVSTINKSMIRLLGLFNSDMREVVELFYLNEEPVILNGEKYEKWVGPLPRTSYEDGLRCTLEDMYGEKT